MTELQGWISLALGAAALVAIVVRLTTGFNSLRGAIAIVGTKLDSLRHVNCTDHQRIDKRLEAHGKQIREDALALAALRATCTAQHPDPKT